MSDDLNKNPFVGLFTTPNEAVSFLSQATTIDPMTTTITTPSAISQRVSSVQDDDSVYLNENNVETGKVNHKNNDREDEIIQQVFGLLLNSKTPCRGSKQQLVSIDSDDIENGIFERLTLLDIPGKLVPKNGPTADPHFLQSEVITYLFECYCRLEQRNKDNDIVENLKKITLRSAGTALQPDIFQDQEVIFFYFFCFFQLNYSILFILIYLILG